jgi:hypothetical protein
MSKPVIFTISAVWDDDASVWSGHCDDIPAAADAPTLDALLAKISAMALGSHEICYSPITMRSFHMTGAVRPLGPPCLRSSDVSSDKSSAEQGLFPRP